MVFGMKPEHVAMLGWWENWYLQMLSRVDQMDDTERKQLLEAARAATVNNCNAATFEVAQLLKKELKHRDI